MSNAARWRLGCHPTAEGCEFVVTNRGDLTKALRFDCTKHYGGFLVEPSGKRGFLKFTAVDYINKPIEKPAALTDKEKA